MSLPRERPTPFRPRFAHSAAGGATGPENRPCGYESLFLVRYVEDLGMARGWQIPFPGTHRTGKLKLPRGVSTGESNVRSRGGTTEWLYSWEQHHRAPQIQLLLRTSPCGMRSEVRESKPESTRGNAFSAGGGSGRGTRTGFAVSYAMRPRPGSSGGSSRSSMERRHSLDRQGARARAVPVAPGRIR